MSDADEVLARLEEAQREGVETIRGVGDLAQLEEARVRVMGRKSPLARARGGLGKLSEEERRSVGRRANEVQRDLEDRLQAKADALTTVERSRRFERERIDVTLPGDVVDPGAVHPLTKTIWEIVDVFVGLGYKVAEGPEIELSRYNFDALNAPPEHPARSPQDTFYIDADYEICLRPQTSPMQVRVMESQAPPVYVVVPGRCYRRDVADATHLNSFTQIEGLAVDEGITMGDLKGSLQTFARTLFGRDLDVRLRPHYFPFTEPSAEMDVQCFSCRGAGCRVCRGEGWIEILGCGMVHPFVLEWVGYDTERYTGFAFGMGVERIAALAHGVNDIRYFWENDLRFLSSFGSRV